MLPPSRVRLLPSPRVALRATLRRVASGRGLATVAGIGAALVVVSPARAQTYLHWDLNGFTAGAGGGTAPSGLWNTTDARWCVVADGAGPVVPWINNSIAVFSAGTNATGSYTITLASSPLTVGGLQFQDGTATLTGVGTLQLVNPAAGITPQVALNGQPAAIGAGVTLAGAAGLNFVGAGTLTLAGATTTTGATMIDGVTVRLAAANRLADASPLQLLGTLDLAGFDETVGTLSGDGVVTLGVGRLAIQNAADSTFGGTISGAGSVWKSGAGRLTLTQPAGWTGATRIQAGTLALGANQLFPDTAALTVDGGATFAVGAFTEWIAALAGAGTVTFTGGVLGVGDATNFSFPGTFVGNGTLAKNGAGTLTLDKASPFAGPVQVNAGTLRLGADDALDAGQFFLATNATLDLAGRTLQPAALTGDGTVLLNGGRLFLDGLDPLHAHVVGPGTLIKTGGSWTRLFGTFGPSGTLEVQQGEFFVPSAANLGAGTSARVAAGASLALNSGAFTLDTIDAAGAVHLGLADLTLAGAGASKLGGTFEGGGALTKSGTGTLTVSGLLQHTGLTSVLGGTMRLTGGDRLPSGAAVRVEAGATLELDAAPASARQEFGTVTGAGDLRAAGPNDTIVLGQGDASFTFDGRLRGAGAFVKTGAGTLTLAGPSDGTGEFYLTNGTVRLGADDGLPSQTAGSFMLGLSTRLELAGHTQHVHALYGDGLADLGGGVLILTGESGFAGTITGSGRLEKDTAATDNLYGPLTFSGPTRVRAGTLQIGWSGAIDTDVQIDAGATLDTRFSAVAVDELTGAGTLVCEGGEFGVGATGTTFSFGGTITASLATSRFVKNGAGRFTLTGTSAVPLHTIAAGTLALGADERLADTTAVHVAAGAYFDVANRTETIDALTGPGKTALGTGKLTVGAGGGSFTLDGTVTAGARFTKAGPGECVLAGRIVGADSVLLQNGVLRLGGDDRLDAALDLAMNGAATFDLGGFAQTLREIEGFGTVNLPASSVLTLDPGATSTALAVNFTGPGRVVKRGAGALLWQGTAADLLDLAVEGGALRLGGSQRFAPATKLTLGAGAWFESGAFTQDFGELAGPGELRLAPGGAVRASQGTFEGPLTGAGTFEKVGATSLTLAQPQSFPGALRALNGTLGLGAGAWSCGQTFVAKGGVLALPGGSTLAGPVEINGTLMLGGGGPTVALDGAVTGLGGIHGNASLLGRLAPGTAADPYGLFACSGAMKLGLAHTLTLELGGYSPGLSHDQILCAGTLTLGGTLRIERHHGFALEPGRAFQVFQAGAITGAFATLELPVLPPGYAWDPTRLGVDGTLRVVTGFEAWALGYGLDPATTGAPLANPSGDGVANLLKYLFRGNPLVAQSDLAPTATVELNAGAATLVFSYRRDALAALDLGAIVVESSADLATWAPVAGGVGGARVVVTPLDVNLDLVTVRIPLGDPRGFARLRVER